MKHMVVRRGRRWFTWLPHDPSIIVTQAVEIQPYVHRGQERKRYFNIRSYYLEWAV